MTKKRKKGSTRKDRVVEVRVDFGKDVGIAGMSRPGEEPCQFFGADGQPLVPKHIEIGVGYHRDKPGLKVIQRAGGDSGNILRDANRALLRFKTIIAVDTNTISLDGTQVNVTVAGLVRDIRFDDSGRWHATLIEQEPFEFHDSTAPPERVGWWEVLERSIRSGLETPVALVVDHDLGRLPQFNSRAEAVLDCYFLPTGYELVYACGDRGTVEYLGSAAIAACDRSASRVLDVIRKQTGAARQWPDIPAHARVESKLFSRGRRWSRDVLLVQGPS
jgi:hypothetical protein